MRWTLDPVGLPGLAAAALGFLIFLATLLTKRARAGREDRAGVTRSTRSMIGIVLQGVAIGMSGFGPILVALDPLGAKALIEAAAVAALMAATIGLFFWSARTMGRNWSIVARTRGDHSLVTSGPFAYIRHPIYVALFLMMIALAIAFGHTARLVVTVPLYAIGTWIRVAVEERLLRAKFGAEYDAFATRVKRFVPGVF